MVDNVDFCKVGVSVIIDSKALFSVIGSEMDYKEEKLSSQFIFNNPNVKEACGCGQSFTV
jgi:iron-sulfur cluster assembly protein